MDFKKIVLEHKDKIIEDLVALLRIESVLVEQESNLEAPFGEGIKESLDFMLELGKSMNFATLNVDNIAGHIAFQAEEANETLGILCHLDVVPAGQGWATPPFSADIRNNRIYARGAIDDKGPTIAALYAMKIVRDLDLSFSKNVKMILGTDEETRWRGIRRYLKQFPMPDIAFAPDANFPLIYGEKGILSLDVTGKDHSEQLVLFSSGERYNVVPDHAEAKVKGDFEEAFYAFLKERSVKGSVEKEKDHYIYRLEGVGAHAMQPHKGKNAGVYLAEFLQDKIKSNTLTFVAKILSDSSFKKVGMDFSDDEMGALTMNVGVIRIENMTAKIGLNLRYPKGWIVEKFMENIIDRAMQFDLKAVLLSNDPVHFVDKTDPFIKTLHDAYIKYTGDDKTPLLTIGGGTYARSLKKAVAFGPMLPGAEDVVHQVDEYINIDMLLTATAIYAQAIYDLVK